MRVINYFFRAWLTLVVFVLSGLLFVSYAGIAGAVSPDTRTATKPVPTPPILHNQVAKPRRTDSIRPFGGNGFTIALAATPQTLWPTQYSTLTATTNADVGPTPYYISVYDATSHTELAVCGSGTTCSASVTQQNATTHAYQAYVGDYPASNSPPGFIIISSPVVNVTWQSVTISLAASKTTQSVGNSVTLTSTTSVDIGPTPFYAEIFDTTTGALLMSCGYGTSCAVTTSQTSATTHRFITYVSGYSSVYPPSGIQATSNASYVTWANSGYNLALSMARTSSGQDTVTATSTVNVGPTPYYMEIFDLSTGSRVAVCSTGSSCAATVALVSGRNDFVAFISSLDTTLPPANTQASSNVGSDWF